jgi:multiple sugar transport system substrate-binding protein
MNRPTAVVNPAPGKKGSALSRRAMLGHSAALAGAAGVAMACTTPGNSNGGGAVPTVTAARGDIRWLSRGLTDVQRQMRSSFGTAFEKANPGTRVLIDYIPPADAIEQKLQVAVAGGDPPDLAFISASQYQALVVQKMVVSLEEYVRRDKTFKKDDYFPIWLKGLQFQGQQYALPFDPSVILLYYNRAMFDRAQLPRLDPNKVPLWDELLEPARRLTVDRDGSDAARGGVDPQSLRQVGMALASYVFWMLPRQNGQDIYTADGTQMALGQPAVREALQWLIDLRAKHKVAVPSPAVNGVVPLTFESGTAGLYWQGLWNVPATRAGTTDDWDVVPLPQFRGKPRVGVGWASGDAVVAGARNPDGGWHFAKYLAGPETQAVLMREGNVQPMLKSQANHPAYREGEPPHSKDVALKESEVATVPPFYPHSADVQNMLVPGLDAVAKGQESLDAMIARLTPAMNQKISEFRSRYGY